MTFRAVDIGTEAMVPYDPDGAGAAPVLLWVHVADLVVDETYQRPLGPKNWTAIRKIAQAFSWQRFSPIVVSRISGFDVPGAGSCFAIIDGQHRAHAARLCGIVMVPAMVVEMGRAEQAAAFAAINGDVIEMSAFHVYRAALTAGEPWAMAARDAVRDGGCVLMDYSKSNADKRPREVYSVKLIRTMVESGKADIVARGLRCLAAMEDPPIELFAAKILSPWFEALSLNGMGMGEADLRRFVEEEDLVEIHETCVDLSRTDDYRGTPVFHLASKAYATRLKYFRQRKGTE